MELSFTFYLTSVTGMPTVLLHYMNVFVSVKLVCVKVRFGYWLRLNGKFKIHETNRAI